MEKQLQQVADFHTAFNAPIRETPGCNDPDRARLRLKLLREELEELEEAIINQDLVETADALADLQYVLCGTVLEFGMQQVFERLFDEVHRSNMSKLDEDGQPILRADGKILKSGNFTPPDLFPIIRKGYR